MVDLTGDCPNDTQKVKSSKKSTGKKAGFCALLIAAAIGLGLYGKHKYDTRLIYTVNDETRRYELENTISYNQLKTYDIMTLDVLGKTIYVIGKNVGISEYKNVLNGQKTYYMSKNPQTESISAPNLITSEDIEQYLVLFDDVQAYYTYEDLQSIYEKISTYKEEQSKTLTR